VHEATELINGVTEGIGEVALGSITRLKSLRGAEPVGLCGLDLTTISFADFDHHP